MSMKARLEIFFSFFKYMPLCIYNTINSHTCLYSQVSTRYASVVNIECAHQDWENLNDGEHAFSSISSLCRIFVYVNFSHFTITPTHQWKICNNSYSHMLSILYIYMMGLFLIIFGIFLFLKSILNLYSINFMIDMAFIDVALILNLCMLNDPMNKILIHFFQSYNFLELFSLSLFGITHMLTVLNSIQCFSYHWLNIDSL